VDDDGPIRNRRAQRRMDLRDSVIVFQNWLSSDGENT
jgi:hypothetical protein